MPIIVKEYTWRQTPSTLNIRIPLNPVSREKVDLFTTDSYIKAHYSPFLFEIFLLHDVDNDKSKCVVKGDEIIFDLIKREEVDWETLEKELTKPEKMKLKQEILEKSQKKAQEESEEKRIRKSQMDRFTVQQAMEIDTKHHNLMDSRRDEQRKVAMNALEEWRVNADKKGGVTIVELPDETPEVKQTEGEIPKVKPTEGKTESKITETAKPPRPRKPVKTPVRSEYVTKKKEEVATRVLPRLRSSGTVEVSHKPRSFPTPSRESAAAEEQAWLRNVTMARRATGFVSEDLRPEEQDPQWCKEKGDEFFRAGNFLGAISAYTHGITLSDRLPCLFANRAATHFALGNFNKCVNDCSSALDLMQPACEGNRHSRAKCIARRAAGLARLGYLTKAIGEMKAASKLLPDDEKIKKDVYDMERAWEQDPDSE